MAFTSLHDFPLSCRHKHKAYSYFLSPLQFFLILTTFPYPRVIHTSSLHVCSKAQRVLSPSCRLLRYNRDCLSEKELLIFVSELHSMGLCLTGTGHWSLLINCPSESSTIQDLHPRPGRVQVQRNVQLGRRSRKEQKARV